jgi:polysaccharide biosynthesis/export protein
MLTTLTIRVLMVWCIMTARPGNTVHAEPARAEEAMDLYRKGNDLYSQGSYRQAQEYYKKAAELMRTAELEPPQEAEHRPSAHPAPQEAGHRPLPLGPGAQGTEARGEYTIGQGDIIHLSVWQNPDLEQETVVRPDGKISVPLVGDIPAVGLTLTQLDDSITRQLREFIRRPEVSLSISKLGGNKVLVLGAVNAPGVYSVNGQKSVLEAISLAQGFHKDAAPTSVILIRGGLRSPVPQRLNLAKALRGMPRENTTLLPEDVIYVPRKFIADVNYVLSQILDPIAKGVYTAKELQTF